MEENVYSEILKTFVSTGRKGTNAENSKSIVAMHIKNASHSVRKELERLSDMLFLVFNGSAFEGFENPCDCNTTLTHS